MKVLIGTMYCGEGDFVKCCEAIGEQIGNHKINHFVIPNLPEKEAHNALFSLWNEFRSVYDVFIKVDADTIIHARTVAELCKLIMSDESITGIQSPLYDYYTNENINGLNCFTNKVSFSEVKDNLYCDRNVEVGHIRTISSNNVPISLQPAGIHCVYATLKQSFHYGVHRGLKNQHSTYKKVTKAYSEIGGINRLYAIRGFEMANELKENFDYNDETFNKAFNNFKNT